MTYVITGATGDVGSRVVRQLLEREIRPRIVARSEAKARQLFGDTVDVFLGDLSDPMSFQRALDGADALFLVNVGPQIPQRDKAAAQVAKQMGVKKLIKLSSLDVEHGLAIGAWHEQGEAAIRLSSIAFTFVRPAGFMSNLLAWAPAIKAEQIVRSSTADGRRPFIHSEDIAAVSIEALLTDAYLGQAIPITGPESLTFADATATIAKAIGRALKFESISDEEARERYARISGSVEETEAHVALWRAIREGRLAPVTHEVERVLGREPITLAQWVTENKASFTG